MITVTIRFQELEKGNVDVNGQIVRQCATRAEATAVLQYDIQEIQDDMRKVAAAELRKGRERDGTPGADAQ